MEPVDTERAAWFVAAMLVMTGFFKVEEPNRRSIPLPVCKICGKPVTAAPVHHPECWEKKIHEVAEKFCDHFCVWPRVCQDEERLAEHHCDRDCPLIQLLNLGL